MISFDERGNPIPYAVISTTLVEIEASFAGTPVRARLFEGLVRYNQDLNALLRADWRQWLNGSFTTLKPTPNDVDVVNFVLWSERLNENRTIFGERFWANHSKRHYLVDGHFVAEYPKNDPRHADTVEMTDYWTKWFGRDRNGNLKGIPELNHAAP